MKITLIKTVKAFILIVASTSLVACSGSRGGGLFSRIGEINANASEQQVAHRTASEDNSLEALGLGGGKTVSIFDALRAPDQNTDVRVNKYLWNASLETLSFLPVESADPFTGVLVMGWGRAPGSSRQYRATVLVQDPALDARSLKVSVQTRGGVASAETVRRIEDAILTRARQLRVRAMNL